MAIPATVQTRRAPRPILFSSFGNMEHVLHEADRMVPILFKGQDISFLPNIKEVVREHTQEFKWKSIILNVSKGMARQEMDTFINFKPPHVGPLVLDATAHTPEHEVFYDDALLLTRKERLIRLNDTTKDAMYILYGIHSLPTPLQMGMGMARFYYMGVTIDRLLEIEADIDANTDEPSYRSGLKKALGATLAAHSIYNNDSPFRETHTNESRNHFGQLAGDVFTGLAAAYAATQVPHLKTQISSMLDEMKHNPEYFKNHGLAIDGRPNHVNTITENAVPRKNLLNDVASDAAALIAAEHDPQAEAALLNSPATGDAVHRSAYLTDALEDNTETQNLLHNNPGNHHLHTFEPEEPPEHRAEEQRAPEQYVQQQQAQARRQPTQAEAPTSAQQAQASPAARQATPKSIQDNAGKSNASKSVAAHNNDPQHEHPSIPLLHETNRYSEIKAISVPDEAGKTIAPAQTAQTARQAQQAQPAAHQPEHYESYAAEHPVATQQATRSQTNDNDSIAERAGNTPTDTPRETRAQSHAQAAPAEQAQGIDAARNEERLQPAQQAEGIERPERIAAERPAAEGDSIAHLAGESRTDTPRETRPQSHAEAAPAEQAHGIDGARNEERLQRSQQSQGTERPERIAVERSADEGERIRNRAGHIHADDAHDAPVHYDSIADHAGHTNPEHSQHARHATSAQQSQAGDDTRLSDHLAQERHPEEQAQHHAQDARTQAHPYDSQDRFIDENIKERSNPRNGETQQDARDARAPVQTNEQQSNPLPTKDVRGDEYAERDARMERTMNPDNDPLSTKKSSEPPKDEFKEGYDKANDTLEKAFKHDDTHEASDLQHAIQENAELNEQHRQTADLDNKQRHQIAELDNIAERDAIDLAEQPLSPPSADKHKKEEKKKDEELHPHHPDDLPKPEPT